MSYLTNLQAITRFFLLSVGLDKGECTAENIERIKSWVPPNMAKYVEGTHWLFA